MKTYISFFLFFVASILVAQDKKISLEEIWGGAFQTESMQSLQSLKNGKEYIVQDYNRQTGEMKVDVFSYKKGDKTRTLFSSKDINGLDFFQTFELNSAEDKVLLGNQMEQIYRHSARGVFHMYDLNNDELIQISENKIQQPTFSPDNTKVAYVYENNLYYKDLVSGETIQLTKDGVKNEIINGLTDWVYEEEFAFVRAFEWDESSAYLAYLKFDEKEVPEFSMDMYGTYGSNLYPQQEVFKYPKAGEKNAEVSLHIIDLENESEEKVSLEDYEYIPRIKSTQKEGVFSAQTMNRHQNHLKLYFVQAASVQANLILEEKEKAYVDVDDDLTFLADNSFIWSSEQDGWKHLYHYTSNGKLKNQITKGKWEVTKYYGYDASNNKLFYQSTENGSVNRDVFSIGINGKRKKRLTQNEGTHSASFSSDYTYFINTFQNVNTPPVYTLHLAKNGKMIRKILDNKKLLDKLANYNFSDKELSTIDINENRLNMWMIKPSDFDAEKTYPLLMFQYSGPGSQSVSNTFFNYNDYWYQLLADEGYIVICVDGRGTGFKGRDFKKSTQKELGKYELEDQISVAEKMSEKSWIDEDRIGIWGWSFGGYLASNAILQASDVFSTAIAVAPVTSWRFYDTIYTERYMTTPQENASGYDNNSPITHVNKLEGNYLLIHGGGDDNVHVQNSMQMIEALIQANKQFDWRIYPDKNHGIYGGNTRLHLYTLMTNYIKENL
ncbi:MAG: S9 family peptidase [Bacteroidota bacterium]